MPSRRHEDVAGLFRSRPELAGELLDPWRLPLPEYRNAQLAPAQFNLGPRELRADAVVIFRAKKRRRPVLAVVVEVQLREARDKLTRWPLYVHALHDRLRCPTVLLVVCPDQKVATWARTVMDAGFELSTVRALVLGPDVIPVITDPDTVSAHPDQAVLSAIAHARHPEHNRILDALVDGLNKIDSERAAGYTGVVLEALSAAARAYLETRMATKTYVYRSKLLRDHVSQGEAKGKAEALLAILDARSIPVPDDVRTRITTCADLKQLGTWIRQASTATTIHDLFHRTPS